jgi:hypothetical protein
MPYLFATNNGITKIYEISEYSDGFYLGGAVQDSSMTGSSSRIYPFAARIESGGVTIAWKKYYIDSDGSNHYI